MPWEYLEEEAIADIGIKVTGNTLDELFDEACLSIAHLMTEVAELDEEVVHEEVYNESSLENLLHAVLEEILFLKDAHHHFLIRAECSINQENCSAKVTFCCGKFDRAVHQVGNDIKAITMHDLYVKRKDSGWTAHFIIDI